MRHCAVYKRLYYMSLSNSVRIVRAHGQIGSLGSSLSRKSVMWVWPSMLKQRSYLLPATSALQLQCQLSTSEDSMSKPPEVVPNMVLAAKQTQVLNMAHELEAWNLQALHASSFELYALSLALKGSSTTGIGGTPFLAGEGNFFFSKAAAAGPAIRASRSTTQRMLRGAWRIV